MSLLVAAVRLVGAAVDELTGQVQVRKFVQIPCLRLSLHTQLLLVLGVLAVPALHRERMVVIPQPSALQLLVDLAVVLLPAGVLVRVRVPNLTVVAVLLVLPEMLLLVWAVTELETMVVQALLQQAHFMQPVVQVVLAGLADRPLPVLLARSGLVLPQQLQVSLSFTARAVWV
jgi:hypothetical protein